MENKTKPKHIVIFGLCFKLKRDVYDKLICSILFFT